ncbi:winged helix-turn-helix domain-containing protein [Paraburkholderia rhizosphaerae]|uniref:DNA-binding response OmpR family regulator n=1 Tax=Paraburkholderia rhizosphaerae TaxID=480658 RepID=A0A4R8L489_9BURK|nr:winged helix-turn-helix domain-containing protein [Paraburkholderia rhizosphaerae]TDY37407.1 DNA-binding response OmpR family regulator [Paraburkholderia rhizosphaerae]
MGAEAKVLIVEADTSEAEILWRELRQAGHEPLVAFSVERATLLIAQECPRVILMRPKLPDGSGMSLINGIRAQAATSRLPIIVLGDEAAGEDECIRALEKGADAYVKKPYGIRELLARIQVVLRPVEYRQMRRRVSFETLSMDLDARRVWGRTGPGSVDEVELKLVPTCYRLLRFFVENPYTVLSRKDIVNNVWFGKALSGGIIDIYINQLRDALKPLQASITIRTVRGVGFCLSKPTGAAAEDAGAEIADVADDAVRGARTDPEPPVQTLHGARAGKQPDPPVLISNLDAAIEKIHQLQSLLRRKSRENELLRNAIEAEQLASQGSATVRPKNRKLPGH